LFTTSRWLLLNRTAGGGGRVKPLGREDADDDDDDGDDEAPPPTPDGSFASALLRFLALRAAAADH
jgi:hypothetical protein